MLKSLNVNGVKVYNLSAGKTLPQFLDDAQKNSKSLKKNEDFRRRIELIQHFDFPIASQKVAVSENQQFIAAVGIYPPEIRMYETATLGMKFSRRLDAEVVDFLFLSDDYRKLVFLLGDRTLEFHAQGGRHHRIRIPKMGRALDYHPETAELLAVGSSNEIYRIDLEQGTYSSPLLSATEGLNFVKVHPSLPIATVGGDGGIVEGWDLRAPRAVSNLSLDPETARSAGGEPGGGYAATCADWSPDGLHIAVGDSEGVVRVFDLRSSKALCTRDHRNGLPIKSVQCMQREALTLGGGGGKNDDVDDFGLDMQGEGAGAHLLVASLDERAVKIWSCEGLRSSGSMSSFESSGRGMGGMEGGTRMVASVETGSVANQACVFPDSGLLMIAQDSPRIGLFFIPALGMAPRWCAYLEGLIEELEEAPATSVFDDYQFVTRAQLRELGAEHLVGTGMLRAYMHGFFMDSRLYRSLREVATPFAIEEMRKRRVQERMDASRKMRIEASKRPGGVNSALEESLNKALNEGKEEGASQKRKKAAEQAEAILSDDRFGRLFSNPDFQIEEVDGPSRSPFPSAVSLSSSKAGGGGEDEEDDEDGPDAVMRTDADMLGESDEDEEAGGSRGHPNGKMKRQRRSEEEEESGDEGDDEAFRLLAEGGSGLAAGLVAGERGRDREKSGGVEKGRGGRGGRGGSGRGKRK
uniref:NUC153 domain-containing protein n=1 Tax=Chromera velia CCMP2878 TaxID=1169474 RepID=A0A0G4I4Y4_9ALVE|eukprot:Cvel_11028.t1-p1 / transcript=Cvel_11028.t1 / gene=Cvel_11028 / organism=Chromera_velia_CCMP2878 / gene_product=Nucleolar protein 10, putative / transcript_product=Nucleolar protein 10, putative / location=Cvel_scaffold680:27225-32460(+) / protein_length=693 / sequence_SO=supercontig / SO=protein_coding / is_pseudo=false